jgi:RNA polymerase sigma-70 factor, ECF subfamily
MPTFIPVFEEAVMPHLDAAYNLARWLTRDEKDAEDVVQEAYLRALRHFGTFKGGDARSWMLAIVRNTFYTWVKHRRLPEDYNLFDAEKHPHPEDTADPEKLLLREVDRQRIHRALDSLPAQFLEVIVLREFEELSYKEIADVVQIPCGTVMSRLARARTRLAKILLSSDNKETPAQSVA